MACVLYALNAGDTRAKQMNQGSTLSAHINLPIVTFDAFTNKRLDLGKLQFSQSLLLDYCFFKHGLW